MTRIVAIGGGEIGRPRENGKGSYPVETIPIDRRIIALTGKDRPRLLFIPTASYDSLEYYALAREHFMSLGCDTVDVLNLSDPKLKLSEIEKYILSFDAIYVGGGNTLRMMTTWRRLGIDKILNKACMQNIVLSGVSAGSICWFDQGSSDSRKFTSSNDQLIRVAGLGYVNALHCPHFNSEVARQSVLKRMTQGSKKVAIALDDCTAIEVVDDKYRIISSKPDAKARKAYWKNGNYHVEEIPANQQYADLAKLLQK